MSAEVAPPSGGLTLHLRPATMDDAALLLAWRNDEATRANSLTRSEVSEADHVRWLTATLKNPAYRLYVAENVEGPVGTARLDFTTVSRLTDEGVRVPAALVNLTVAPEDRGQGWGLAILRALEVEAARLGLRVLEAHVWNTNTPSLLAFIRAGFIPNHISRGTLVWLTRDLP